MIEKKDIFLEDGIGVIKRDYMKYCREVQDSPSVVGMLVFLEKEGMLDRGALLSKMFSERAANKKPFQVVKELGARYGIKCRSLWNYYDRLKEK